MTEVPTEATTEVAPGSQPQPRRFIREFARLSLPYWTEKGAWKARFLLGGLVLLVILQVALLARLNVWNADLFDALEKKSTENAMKQVIIFGIIVMGMMIANMGHLMVRRQIQVDWRRWVTNRVIGRWMDDSHHFQASFVPGDHDNPDGRIAEDIRVLTEASVDLANSFVYCVLLLVTFFGILWSLSGVINLFGYEVPGHLVILAFVYAGIGAVVAFFLGRPLVLSTDIRQTKEADFRYRLVRARESSEAISLARAEPVQRSRLSSGFELITSVWRQQTMSLGRLMAFSSGYGALAGVLPILVGTPRFLDGTLTLGRLMQAAQAFQQVTSALSWPVDNLPRLAEWRASVERVLALEEAVRIVALEGERSGDTAINLDRSDRPFLGVKDLSVAEPNGATLLSDLTFKVEAGEKVLVDGDHDATAALFRVLSGIWPWGFGQVALPDDARMAAFGSRIFLMEGILQDSLSQPGYDDIKEAELLRVLEVVGLSHLSARMGHVEDWSNVLSGSEIQRLAIGRLLLLKPEWVLMGSSMDALEPQVADEMLRLVASELPGTTVVVMGNHPGAPEVFGRRLSLQRSPDGEVLLNEVRARRLAALLPRVRALPLVDWLGKAIPGMGGKKG